MAHVANILTNYRTYLVATFGNEGLTHFYSLPSAIVANEVGSTIEVRANGSETALGLLGKACELYGVDTGFVIDFNGLEMVPPTDIYADLAA